MSAPAKKTADVSELFQLRDFEALARDAMAPEARDLVNEGAGAGRAILANEAAWAKWALRCGQLARRMLLEGLLASRFKLAPTGKLGGERVDFLMMPSASAAEIRTTQGFKSEFYDKISSTYFL